MHGCSSIDFCCYCPCLDFIFSYWRAPPILCDIHASYLDLLFLYDGIDSWFARGVGTEGMVFDKPVLLVVLSGRTRVDKCYIAWVPETPQPFMDYQSRVVMISAVLRAPDLCEECVVVVYDSAHIIQRVSRDENYAAG
jgi:hypothetical protein